MTDPDSVNNLDANFIYPVFLENDLLCASAITERRIAVSKVITINTSLGAFIGAHHSAFLASVTASVSE